MVSSADSRKVAWLLVLATALLLPLAVIFPGIRQHLAIWLPLWLLAALFLESLTPALAPDGLTNSSQSPFAPATYARLSKPPTHDSKTDLPGTRLRVLLVDDDAFNRQGIRQYLQLYNIDVQDAGDESTAWALFEAATFDAAILDISIPRSSTTQQPIPNLGIRLAQRIKQKRPDLGVVLFSAYADRAGEVQELVRRDMRGIAYKLKGCAPEELLSALRGVMAGRVILDADVHSNRRQLADELLARLTSPERLWVEGIVREFNQLTLREKEIVQRLAASHNTEGISKALSLSPRTTENYIGHIYDKLGLNEMGRQAPHLRKVVVLAKACLIVDLAEADRPHG